MFPGGKAGKALSNMAFLMLLRRMGMRTAYQRGDLFEKRGRLMDA